MRPKRLRQSDGAQIVITNGGTRKMGKTQTKWKKREKKNTNNKEKNKLRKTTTNKIAKRNNGDSIERLHFHLTVLMSHISFIDDQSRCAAELPRGTPKPEGKRAAKKMRPKMLRRTDGA